MKRSPYGIDHLGLAIRLATQPSCEYTRVATCRVPECSDERADQLETGQGLLYLRIDGACQEIWHGRRPNSLVIQPEHNMVSCGIARSHPSRFGCSKELVCDDSSFADNQAGGKVSGASPAYNVEEMVYALKTADAKFIFTAPGSIEVGAAAAQQAGIPKSNVFMLEGNVAGYSTIKDLIEIGKSYGEDGQVKAHKIPAGKKNKDVCGFLSFSSGTTGLPKAVSFIYFRR